MEDGIRHASATLASSFREQTASEIIRSMWRIYRENLWSLFLIYAPLVLPPFMLSDHAQATQNTKLMWIASLSSQATAAFAIAPLTVAVSDIHLGHHPGVACSYARLAHRFWPMIGTYLLFFAVTMIGFLLFVIPGVIATVVFMFTLPIVVLEQISGVAAMRQSVMLGRGAYARNVGILVVIVLPIVMVLMSLDWLVADASPRLVVSAFLAACMTILSLPAHIVVVLLYHDMRIRKGRRRPINPV